MVTDKLKLFILAVITLMATHFSASAVTVYFDNSTAHWNPVNIYYWGSTKPVSWPGVTMEKLSGDIYKYDIPDNGITMVIFNNKVNNNGVQTGDLTLIADHVYTQSGDSGKTYEQYIAGGGGGGGEDPIDPDDPDDIDDEIFVYADVPNWTGGSVHAYVYKGTTPYVEWPGEEMTKDPETGYWYYPIPYGYRSAGQVIFYQDDSHRHPGNNVPGEYINGKNMIYRSNGDKWEEYTGNIPDPGELVDYTIYFHNNVSWPNVYVSISGNVAGQSHGGKMESNLNSSIHEISFKAPENASLHCSFYYLNGNEHVDQT